MDLEGGNLYCICAKLQNISGLDLGLPKNTNDFESEGGNLGGRRTVIAFLKNFPLNHYLLMIFKITIKKGLEEVT